MVVNGAFATPHVNVRAAMTETIVQKLRRHARNGSLAMAVTVRPLT